jgi:hypothetical protein
MLKLLNGNGNKTMKLKKYSKTHTKKKVTLRKLFYISNFNKPKYFFTLKKKKIFFFKNLYKKHFKKKVASVLLFKEKFLKKINIKVVQNNIFCTFVNLNKNKTLHTSSSGLYKIKISKRKLKHFYTDFLSRFFIITRRYCKTLNNTVFCVTAPIKKRRKICKLIKNEIRRIKKRKHNILIKIEHKKCFNGCRAKKQLRKKRRLYRIYK